jgi:glycosyltransferase involved in cell wall biosynthesis|tara:strand:- start:5907 stop:6776 length:870 start_codon:yes stop_codon:yes gene_type:complete
MGKKNRKKQLELPFVSICTPTFNRRPFINSLIKCFQNQLYPKNKLEWIIVDDGTDKIKDLVEHIEQVKYIELQEKVTLGKKRNIMHDHCKGDIIVYMDDDDYYPPTRVTHAVDKLMKNPKILAAGSSEMYIYFKHVEEMWQFGPYGPNHATAATFAFKKELLRITRYDDSKSLAEERDFLKQYTIPFIQLDPKHTILVFSHIHNTFDKKRLLENPGACAKKSGKTIDYFIKEDDLKYWFIHEIENLLFSYEAGLPKYKPDVLAQLKTMEINYKKKCENIKLLNLSENNK